MNVKFQYDYSDHEEGLKKYYSLSTYEDSSKFARFFAKIIYFFVKTRADKLHSRLRYCISQCCYQIMHGNYSAKTQIKIWWKHYRKK
jgi:hypothetical protein